MGVNSWQWHGSLIIVSWLVMIEGAVAGIAVPGAADPSAAGQALTGQKLVANAAWWGFDEEDSTQYVQAAIDSGAPRVVIPYVGAPWIVRPITLRSNQEILFEPGVLVLAKRGEFKGRGDSLFSAVDVSNVTLRGYGATLRMWKEDYQGKAYEKAEWRMTLDFDGCRHVRVEGLRLESSGGDGIYVGATSELPYCHDVIIRDVICDDHHRQGISVISAVDLLIENCVLSNTGGTAPQAGIDFEPNHANEKLVNCVLRNCRMADNRGAGVLLYLKNLSRATTPVSLLVENCLITGGSDAGIAVGVVKDDGPTGWIEFRNCIIDGPRKCGAYLYDKSAGSAELRFVNCHWRDTWHGMKSLDKNVRVPVLISLQRDAITMSHGGITFKNCHVYDDGDRPALVVENDANDAGARALHGEIIVHNPHGARMELGPKPADDIDLGVVEAK